MPISGLVIQIDPAHRDAIVTQLSAIDSIDLPVTPPGGKLVAVVDVATMREEEQIFEQINAIPGVTNVSLSYHNFEDISE